MTKNRDKNLRAKRTYLIWLKEAKGLSEASIDRAAASIDRYLEATRGTDLGALHPERIRTFKRQLEAARSVATGKPLSSGSIDGTLRDLKAFFGWLADQPGYRSRVSRADVAYFTPGRRLARQAHGGRWVPHPSPEQVRHAISAMPDDTVIARRDRAILAFLILTGARDGALITLRLRNIDIASGCVHFEGREVETKFGKVFTTWFFPTGDDVRRIVEDWIGELRTDLFWGPGDPLFPKQETGIGPEGGFVATGLARAPWANASKVAAICKQAFAAAGLPAFTPHLIRKTLVDLANEHCRTPEDFKAWSQNLGHDDVLTTFRSYGCVAPGRQRELIARMSADADPLIES